MAFSDYVRLEVALTTEPYAGTATWTDVTSQVRSLSCVMSDGQATQLRASVNNNDGRWDPASTYVSAPYSGNVKRDRLVRFSASDDGFTTSTVLAVLLLDDVIPVSTKYAGTAELVATDWLRVLQEHELDAWTRTSELPGDRAAALFTEVGIPAGAGGQADYLGVVNAGTVLMPAATYSGSALAAAQDMARAEQGMLWTRANGNLTFRDRYHIIDRTEFNTSQITLDEDTELFRSPIVGDVTGFERRVTAIAASGESGRTITYTQGAATNNPTSTDHLAGLPVVFDADVGMLAQTVQRRRRTDADVTKPRSVDMWVTGPAASNSTALTGIVDQDIDMFNAVTLTYRPEGWSSDESYVARIVGITHSVDQHGIWGATLDLAPHGNNWQTRSADFYTLGDALASAGDDRLAM